jgi:hypothetical protein
MLNRRSFNIWYWLWKLFGVRPVLRSIVVVTGDNGQWILSESVGFTMRGVPRAYASIELLRKYNPEWDEYFRKLEQATA